MNNFILLENVAQFKNLVTFIVAHVNIYIVCVNESGPPSDCLFLDQWYYITSMMGVVSMISCQKM